MENILRWIGALCAVLFGWFGDLPSVIRILLLIMVLDIFCGTAEAIIKKTLSSAVALNGVTKKAVMLIVVALAYVISGQIAGPDLSAPIGQTVAGFYIAVEVISILEKADTIGVPIPEFLRKALENYRAQKDIQASG